MKKETLKTKAFKIIYCNFGALAIEMRVLKEKYSTLLSFLFLLLYIFVNSSFVLFHHHHEVSFPKSSVFINQNHFDLEKSDEIQHTQHFSTAKIHCFFCDHQTVSFHQLSEYDYNLINEKTTLKTPVYDKGFTVLFLANSSSRDPPQNV